MTLIDRERTLVATCCALARAAGVRLGMPLAEARAMVKHPIHVEPLSTVDDHRDLQRLARWTYRFVPVVAIDGHDGLLLDARGCAHLYGGLDGLIDRMLKGLRRAAITARIAAAPTFGSAWALARFAPGESSILVKPERLDAALTDLPVAALRIDPASIEALHAVGVEKIGELRALSRSSLISRYAPQVLLRLDQALGQALETLVPLRPKWPMLVEHYFDGPTDRIESITRSARSLVNQLALLLLARHRGSLSLRVELIRSDMDPLWIPVRTSRPCADAPHLWKLLAPKLERAHMGFGVEGVRVRVLWSKRLRDQQATCWLGQQERPAELARLIDTLHARLGAAQVVRPVIVESYLPERAFAFAPVLEHRSAPRASVPVPGLAYDRPTMMLAAPFRIQVSLLAPDGPPVGVRFGGISSSLQTCIGPERVAGEWWNVTQSGLGQRDYFKVQTNDGRWLWIFRNAIEGRGAGTWFLHGQWA